MEKILILEPDERFAAQLLADLMALGDYVVASAPTLREACLLLAQQPQDLALVPVESCQSLVRSLRSLHPGLRIVLLLPDRDYYVPGPCGAAIQGTLVKTTLRDQLRDVLEKAMSAPLPLADTPPPPLIETSAVQVVTDQLQQLVQEDRLLGALLSATDRLFGHAGALDDAQAKEILERVQHTWLPSNTAQIQFYRLGNGTNDLLLYTRRVHEEFLLTFAAQPDTPVGRLRRRADAAWQTVAALVNGGASETSEPQPVPHVFERKPDADAASAPVSYAIVWRPRKPLPHQLLLPVRRALERVAEANACVLSHVQVEPSLVHVVTSCPPERSSAWVAHLFKRGVESEIQEQFGVEAHMWEKGFYAAPSATPLSQAELSLFLSE